MSLFKFKRETKVDKLILKIMKGTSEMSKEELQLYVNNSAEIEKRLRKVSRVRR